MFPITAVILIACIGIFCGCGIICHNFRRQPELSLNVEQLRRPARNQNTASNNAHFRNLPNGSNNANSLQSQSHPPLLRNDSHSSSSKYDSVLYDDPPPKYEDAIKDFPSEFVTVEMNIQPQMAPIKS